MYFHPIEDHSILNATTFVFNRDILSDLCEYIFIMYTSLTIVFPDTIMALFKRYDGRWIFHANVSVFQSRQRKYVNFKEFLVAEWKPNQKGWLILINQSYLTKICQAATPKSRYERVNNMQSFEKIRSYNKSLLMIHYSQ